MIGARRTGFGAMLGALLVAAWLLWRDETVPRPPTPIERASPAADAARLELAPAATTQQAPAPPAIERQAVEATAPTAAKSPATSAELAVHGRVLLATGEPAANADVHIGRRATRTAADGTFTLACHDAEALVAFLVGHEPVCIETVARRREVQAGECLDVVLPGKALGIDGQLLTVDGLPAKGWQLCLHGGTTDCGHDGLPKLSAEDFAAGATGRPLEQWMVTGEPPRNPNESRLRDDGMFCVNGLRRGRDYVLRAWNQSTLQTATSAPIPAGTRGYRFVVPPGEWRERVYGRVIDRHGGAIAEVRVRLTMRVHKSGNGETYETGQEVRTTADGRFEFQRVVRENLLLRFDGRDVLSKNQELPAAAAGEDLLVTLGYSCVLRFEPAPGASKPTALRVLDQAGQPLRIGLLVSAVRSEGSQRVAFPPGRTSITLTVSDAACWLVVECEGQGERRLPLRLQRDQITIVRG